MIIITKYIMKQPVCVWGGGHGRAELGWVSTHPSTCRKMQGLKTAPFQCQGRRGGVNERLGEGVGVKPGCHGVRGGRQQEQTWRWR